MRLYRYTTKYPAFDHTSFNAEWERGRLTVRASLHFKYSRGGGGFWLGVRPELETHRVTDRMEALRRELRDAAWEATCISCGRRDFVRPREWLDSGWRHVRGPDPACPDCLATKTYGELIG